MSRVKELREVIVARACAGTMGTMGVPTFGFHEADTCLQRRHAQQFLLCALAPLLVTIVSIATFAIKHTVLLGPVPFQEMGHTVRALELVV